MATRLSTSLHPYCGDDTNFRAFAQFIEDTLVTTGGWAVTGDTGQTLPASLTHPAAINTKMGYRVYRMTDPLQATAPVFMRLDFGASNQGVTIPAAWVTIGTGSDGAGNITGKVWDGGSATSASVGGGSASNVLITNSYGSADVNRASLALFICPTSNVQFVFCIERTKNATGADTGDGLLLIYNASPLATQSLDTARYCTFSGGVQPAVETGLNYILTSQNPSQSFGGDIGAGVISHFKGVAQQPGVNVLTVNSSDVGVEGSFSLTLYGSTHTYQQLNALVPRKATVGSTITDTFARCCIRYD